MSHPDGPGYRQEGVPSVGASGMPLLLVWLLDFWPGEPPTPLHPVVWMGRYLTAARRFHRPTFAAGAVAWMIGAAGVVAIDLAIQVLIGLVAARAGLWAVLAVALTAVALKPLFAWRALRRAAEAVLNAPDLPAGRAAFGWHLVSRDTSDLTAGEVYGATIESVAENLSDSFVAPALWFLLGGLPAAALYRYANTADAMWCYRTPELEQFGKWAARIDDGLN